MSTMYCNLCKRHVEAKRIIGIGSLILIVLTGGFWLLAIPFYSKRCAICKSDALSDSAHSTEGKSSSIPKKKGTNWIFVLGGIAVIGVIANLIKPKEPQTMSASQVTARPAVAVGLCKRQPLEIFPVGEKFQSNALSKLVDENCPNARFHPDERVEISYGTQRFFVQTKKLNYSGQAFYEIVSIQTTGQ